MSTVTLEMSGRLLAGAGGWRLPAHSRGRRGGLSLAQRHATGATALRGSDLGEVGTYRHMHVKLARWEPLPLQTATRVEYSLAYDKM